MLHSPSNERVFRVAHMACGIGAGAKGFNDARFRVGNMRGRFECAGGIDIDSGAIREFGRITGTPGTVMDLFDREQYIAWHGKEPPADWREATPDDIRRAFGPKLNVIFASYPCKGFSGLLSSTASETDKYQALNSLTLRGIWLQLEAYKDDPVDILLFENVPRMETRGRFLLDRIQALYRHYGYIFAESKHDCGEIGGLAQSRKRFLLVARHVSKVPPFIYQPVKSRLRGVGEVIGALPLPGAPEAGTMHRVPMLQWKTWVRLAFVPAGKDWRALNELSVIDGKLADYGIVPDQALRDNALGVLGWNDTAPTLTAQRAPGQGRFSIADPRGVEGHAGNLGVSPWDKPAVTISSRGGPTNGAYSVADPRGPIVDDAEGRARAHGKYPVDGWDKPGKAVIGGRDNGAYAIADPRVEGHERSVMLGVRPWDQAAGVVTGKMYAGGGPHSVADPRLGRVAHSNVYRVVRFDEAAISVTSSRDVAVADPRAPEREDGYKQRKYKVTPYDEPVGTVISASTTGTSAFAVADPRGGDDAAKLHGKHRVEEWEGAPARTVIAGRDNGASAVADPRSGLKADREGYRTQGHYGVLDWQDSSGAVTANAKHDSGNWNIADPRDVDVGEGVDSLPSANDRLVCRIISLDNTWHRPFTTLELAALQSLFDPGEIFDLGEASDAQKREWIGNAVPSKAARGMAETIGETLLRAMLGEAFTLSSREIWTKPLALALAVDPRQFIYGEAC